MPLPTDPKAPWPPDSPVKDDLATAAAWYEGDPAKLVSIYATPNPLPNAAGRRSFWATPSNQPGAKMRLHLPLASDIAGTSADLLFGDAPTFTVDTQATQDRLEDLIDLVDIPSRLLEGGEVCAALGGVYLRPAWDMQVADHPLLDMVHADRAAPEFRWGQLWAVTFWREIYKDKAGAVWRHLERHETGLILHGLYVGDDKTLGVKRPLEDHAITAAMVGDGVTGPDAEGVLRLPAKITGILPRYVPNVLPNRKHRSLPIGRADTAGTETLMDSLDEVWTSWMRDIRIGKARLIIPEDFLQRRGRGQGAAFDTEQEIFTTLDMDEATAAKAGITPVEFQIRTEEHQVTAQALVEQIVQGSGYSPQTFGIETGGRHQVTATEIAVKETRSKRTVGRKRRYWANAIEETLANLLVIDAELFESGVQPERPSITWHDPAESLSDIAASVNLLATAQAASIETRVRMVNPGLDDADVQAEVDRIRAESGVLVGSPTGQFG